MKLAAINPRLLAIVERSPLGRDLVHGRMFIGLHLALEAFLALDPDPVVTLKVN